MTPAKLAEQLAKAIGDARHFLGSVYENPGDAVIVRLADERDAMAAENAVDAKRRTRRPKRAPSGEHGAARVAPAGAASGRGRRSRSRSMAPDLPPEPTTETSATREKETTR